MKLKTLHVKSAELNFNKQLVKYFWALLPKGAYFHFFYEPDLIIRTESKYIKKLTPYLKSHKLSYRTYIYPTGRPFGESKKGIVMKYFDYYVWLLAFNSAFAMRRKKKEDFQILERYTHTFMNQLGYEWEDETLIYLKLAYGRLGVIRKYDSTSPAVSLLCTIAMANIKIVHKVVGWLK